MSPRKKLIEVSIPLNAINEACKPETENPFLQGHPRSLHNWWARLPLVACRAVLFASLVDDPESLAAPSSYIEALDLLPDPPSGKAGRLAKLSHFLGRLANWSAGSDAATIQTARELIRLSCGGEPPVLLDPFCGRGSIPFEAQRLGLEAHASDLNPVAVLITKALVEIPPRFAGRPPVNLDARNQMGQGVTWKGAGGLAADVRWYGRWMRDRAGERVGHLYPKGPKGETIIAWLWARTVKCPNPACGTETPLLTSYVLSSKKGREHYLVPHVDGHGMRFDVARSPNPQLGDPRKGAKRGMSGIFECLACGNVTTRDYVSLEGKAGRIGGVLTCVVVEGKGERGYLPGDASPVPPVEILPDLRGLEAELAPNPRDVWCRNFGLNRPMDLFTPRQLVALTTFSDLVGEARALALDHARQAGLAPGGPGIADGGSGAEAYADAVATYLAFAVSRAADYHCTICTWNPTNENVSHVFVRQALPMTWDFAEANPVSGKLHLGAIAEWVASALEGLPSLQSARSSATQLDAVQSLPRAKAALVSTDPPYYDNIGYADLSDFFYVWLRRSLQGIYPDLFSTLLTPKAQELIVSPYRWNGSAEAAQEHFRGGLERAFCRIREAASREFPTTVYYAYKQQEEGGNGGTSISTGWEAMLDGLLRAGFSVTGTWPMRTTKAARAVARNTNALASAIVLVCRPRPEDAPLATRREFVAALKAGLPGALRHLVGGHIAPVDLAQAAIGPGMAVFSRYSRVLEPDGSAMTVRRALELINQALEDYFTETEGELDPDSQFCVRWFEQHRTDPGRYGEADVLARAKGVGVEALAREGLVESRGGNVRLAPLAHYLERVGDYDPARDRPSTSSGRTGLTAWEACHYLVAALQTGGLGQAGPLARRLGGLAGNAVQLAYRLYAICERKGWAEEALGYNILADSWPAIQGAAAEAAREAQGGML